MELQTKLVFLRKQKGLSQLDLAEKLDVSRQAISRWEVGSAVPSTDNLKILSELYGVSVDYLLNDENDSCNTGDNQEQKELERESSGSKYKVALACSVTFALVLVLVIIIVACVQKKPSRKNDPITSMAGMETKVNGDYHDYPTGTFSFDTIG